MSNSNRNRMFHVAVMATIGLSTLSTSAHATRCIYPGASAAGPARANIQSARNAAMSRWEQAVAKKYGRRFANWSYAGDGKVDCTWKRDGRDLKCRATAVPCAD